MDRREGKVAALNPDDVLKLENQLCFAVYACSREITKFYRPVLEELGLTYTQYVTMLALWEEEGLTVKELGNRLYLDSGTLTPLLKKLQAMGLITRQRDVQDERNVLIGLTPNGAALKEKAVGIPMKLSCDSGVSLEEAAAIRDQMNALLDRIKQASE